MAAVVRIKRRLDEEPLDALILNCKRRKTNEECKDDKLSALLKFAGTIDEEKHTLPHIKKQQTKLELEEQYKKHIVDLNSKLRQQKQQDSKNSRYKVVKCFRSDSIQDETEPSENAKSEYTIFDIETDLNENSDDAPDRNLKPSNEPKYVYDLYYTNSDDFGDAALDDYVSVEPFNEVLMFGSTRDNGLNEPDSDNDSEDSNAENNWRNDYPDESDLESVNDEDMIEAIKKVDINDDLLSSDDGEEGFVYSIDSEAAGFEEEIDDSDVRRYGERYARFRARNKKTIVETGVDNDLYYGDIDEEEYYY